MSLDNAIASAKFASDLLNQVKQTNIATRAGASKARKMLQLSAAYSRESATFCRDAAADVKDQHAQHVAAMEAAEQEANLMAGLTTDPNIAPPAAGNGETPAPETTTRRRSRKETANDSSAPQ